MQLICYCTKVSLNTTLGDESANLITCFRVLVFMQNKIAIVYWIRFSDYQESNCTSLETTRSFVSGFLCPRNRVRNAI